ncbi:cyclase family protein [Acuticoccus sp. I52.16.1]|uniref:cyclase family protein n=1 Tax=Acuticoccus sp. I52.16.1 TaxID=2928472 RepID=UPI001FD45677|nr:cyclase family protein [Acuticoccus sp. I52.16.1]UOM35324.1 cyclase family protein [Acuticoccus sp. I52.16.1]
MTTHTWKAAGLAAVLAFATGGAALAECQPSKWGADDEIGAANTITPERVMAAAKLVKQGKTQHLGIIIDKDIPAFGARSLSVTILQPGQQWGVKPFPNGFVYNDDIFTGWLGIGSQLDTLAHGGHSGEDGTYFYNCNEAGEISKVTGMTKLGLEKVPPLVARGVVLDMAAHAGKEHLDAGEYFTADDVKAQAEAQGVTLGEGDVVLFHTGWTEHVLPSDPQAWGSGEPGMSEDVADYMAELGVLAVGADTWGVDVIPPQNPDRPFQGHITLLKENGIYILEVMNTGPLVADDVSEFMFVLGPSRLRGAVQAIIDPIALY